MPKKKAELLAALTEGFPLLVRVVTDPEFAAQLQEAHERLREMIERARETGDTTELAKVWQAMRGE